jgi:CTP synthase
VGDIESLPFLEAIRQLRLELGRSNSAHLHLTLVPFIAAADELKTKPTQHSVRELRAIGISADAVLCRCDRPLPSEVKQKIALFCNLEPRQVIAARDVSTIYEVPLSLSQEGLDELLLELLNLPKNPRELTAWEALVSRIKHPTQDVRIGIVGKYVELPDAYKSLNEALMHGGIANDARVELVYIDAEQLEGSSWPSEVHQVDGLLVPIGFGPRGTRGKIRVMRYARENRVPMFGICLGMQCMVIEYARNVCGIAEANSSEIDPETSHAVIYKLRDLLGVEEMGGTMRLGAYPCRLREGSLARRIYGSEEISERHRHRYEVNQKYLKPLVDNGLVVSGMSPDGKFVEMVELTDHPWYLGCQFHPEYKSKPTAPHPLFVSYIRAALERRLSAPAADVPEAVEVRGGGA